MQILFIFLGAKCVTVHKKKAKRCIKEDLTKESIQSISRQNLIKNSKKD